MKTFLITLMAVFVVGLQTANACSVMPVSEVAQKNDLTAQALTKIGVSIENVQKVSISDYYGRYIWTPMCPKGLQSGAKIEVSYTNVNDPLTKGCLAIVEVDKNFLYEDGAPEYLFNLVQARTCLE